MTISKTGRALAGTAALSLVLAAAASTAQAAGFAVREVSGSQLGNAFAGMPTSTDDITNMAYNPATMGYQSGNHITSVFSYIVPNSEFEDGEASTVLTTPINTTSEFNGNGDIGENALVPALYSMISITDEIKVGFNVTAPFGLETDNNDGWVGRYHALESRLATLDFNPTVAYRPIDWLSLGVGFRAIYADARLTNAVDIGTIGAALSIPGSVPAGQDGFADLQGDDWGFGYNLGVMAQVTDQLRLGVGYRSRVDIEIDGDTDFDLSGSGTTGAALQAGGRFTNTDATAEVTLPDSVAFGAHFDLDDEWGFMAQAEWTQWSLFDELVIEFDNPNQPDNVTIEDWDDSWFFGVGSTYKPAWAEDLTLRLGFAYDQSPVPEKRRTPRIPDEDRYWIAFGAGYSPFPWLEVSASYTHIFIPDADIDLEATDEDTFRGNLSGTYEAGIDIFALQGTLRF